MTQRDLYPAIEPYRTDRLQVSALHKLYIEECGNPDGVPIVHLHGGPGAGSSPMHRRFFDPTRYRIILFDQRGSGQSMPLGELAENNADLLVADLEAIRKFLGIERWHVFGCSWGSTLALAYAQANPAACISLTLQGIFLLRPWEIQWLTQDIRAVFPEAWAKFAAFIPEDERSELLDAYIERLNDNKPWIHLPTAQSWLAYESACASLIVQQGNSDHPPLPRDLAMARIEANYLAYQGYDPDSPRDLLRNIDRIRKIPSVIVQGRYDMICPIRTADELHRAWPEADYIVIPDAGHSNTETGIRAALVEATDRFASIR